MQDFEQDCRNISVKHNMLVCAVCELGGGMYFAADFSSEKSIERAAEYIAIMQRSLEKSIIELDVCISKQCGFDPGHFTSLVRKSYEDQSINYNISVKDELDGEQAEGGETTGGGS